VSIRYSTTKRCLEGRDPSAGFDTLKRLEPESMIGG